MAVGDVRPVRGVSDLHYVDTGMFDTPWYGAVYVLDGPEPAVVDAGIGTDRERVLAGCRAAGVDPTDLQAVLLTHVHLDHASGAGFLADVAPEATVYVHEAGAPHVVDPSRLVAGTKAAVGDAWRWYTEPDPVPEDRVVALADGDPVPLGGRTLTAHRAPGHAPHQVVYRDERSGAVFVGDAAGIWVPPRGEVRETSPPPQFDLEQCLADLDTVHDLDPAVLCYPHFGPGPDDVSGVLEAYAETLEEWVERVAAVRAELGDDEAVLEHLADGTDLEDVWGPEKARAEARLNARGVLAALED